MENRKPKQGEIYIHFKKKPYQITAIASHSETGEEMVVYQALYGDFKYYVRPLSMFISEVDHQKYPQIKQKFRFELAEKLKEEGLYEEDSKDLEINILDMEVMDLNVESILAQEEDTIAPALLAFLDTDNFAQKLQVLKDLKPQLTNRLVDDFAVALDIVVDKGSLEERYHQLETCLKTFVKYENERLR